MVDDALYFPAVHRTHSLPSKYLPDAQQVDPTGQRVEVKKGGTLVASTDPVKPGLVVHPEVPPVPSVPGTPGPVEPAGLSIQKG